MLAKTDSPWTHGKETSLRTGLSHASFFVAKNFILVGVIFHPYAFLAAENEKDGNLDV